MASTRKSAANATLGKKDTKRLLTAILVPVAVLITVLIVVLCVMLVRPSRQTGYRCTGNTDCYNGGTCSGGTCKCQNGWSGDACGVVSAMQQRTNVKECSKGLAPCGSDSDCVACASSTGAEYACQDVTADQSAFNVAGKYCLPLKPSNWCAPPHPCIPSEHCDPATGMCSCDTMSGIWYWEGWKDVETMAWTCACEYDNYYPQDLNTGACVKSGELCRGGKWKYPCVPDGSGGCLNQTPAQVGGNPQVNGKCYCQNSECVDDGDCVTMCQKCNGMQCDATLNQADADKQCQSYATCASDAKCNLSTGVCVGKPQTTGMCKEQRTGLNGPLGIPTCVTDTCTVHCGTTACTTDDDCSLACRPGAKCDAKLGVCHGMDHMPQNQGRWVGEDKIAPYVYGTCKCPPGCINTGLSCDCNGAARKNNKK